MTVRLGKQRHPERPPASPCATRRQSSGDSSQRLAGFALPMLLALGGRLASRLPQRTLNTGTTNLPALARWSEAGPATESVTAAARG
jgi:hypothetical protein